MPSPVAFVTVKPDTVLPEASGPLSWMPLSWPEASTVAARPCNESCLVTPTCSA